MTDIAQVVANGGRSEILLLTKRLLILCQGALARGREVRVRLPLHAYLRMAQRP
jgi:hypothetical protein